MKKVCLLVLALVLVGALALAEGVEPSMFLVGRGLMVLDEEQLRSMGSDGTGSESFQGLEGSTMCGFAPSEQSTPAIMLYDGEKLYIAFDMTSMFGEGTMDSKAIGSVFIDFCNAYDYDIFFFGEGDEGLIYCRDDGTMEKFLSLSDDPSSVPNQIYQDKAEFLAACTALLG